MNCVQCGEALPASAKFCKACGCKVGTATPPLSASSPAASAPATAASRALPVSATPAYTTCPDCGALCKGDAAFCNKCGCRFEEATGFEDTKRDTLGPQVEADKAILVFGNVQDSSEPAMPPGSERIQTSPAMVIGGTAAVAASAIAAPAQWPKEPATARDSDWLVSDKPSSATAPAKAAPAGSRPASPIPASNSAPKDRKPSERNPMPTPPASNTNGGNGMLIAAGLLGLAVLVGGGAWWWNTQGKFRKGVAATETAPAATAAPAPSPAPLPAEAVLTPNESIAPPVAPVAPEPVAVAAPAVAPVVAEPPVAAPAPVEAPRPAAPRKPARKQTLDDLLN